MKKLRENLRREGKYKRQAETKNQRKIFKYT